MRKRLTIVAAGVFILGTIAAPALHLAALGHDEHTACSHGCRHSRSEPVKHDAEHCSICQLAQAPLAATVPAIAPAPVAAFFAFNVPSYTPAPTCRVRFVLPFSCGPPA